MIKKRKGFTLVELLAVIVVLAVILVIAVPKINDEIEKSKMNTLEISAKIIADAAEDEYANKRVLNQNISQEEFNCSEVAKLNNSDYSSCKVIYDENGKAYVTILGGNKFQGLSICSATKKDAKAIAGFCPMKGSCFTTRATDIEYAINYDECIDFVSSEWWMEGEAAETYCRGNVTEYNESIEFDMEDYQEDFFENNVITITGSNLYIMGYNSSCGTNLIIPSEIDNFPVVGIDYNAFYGASLESVSLPSTIEKINESAFENNSLSGELDLSNVTSLTYIGSTAFRDNNITSVKLPNSVSKIGGMAFENNALTKISGVNATTNIGTRAFGSTLPATHNLTSNQVSSYLSETPASCFTTERVISSYDIDQEACQSYITEKWPYMDPESYCQYIHVELDQNMKSPQEYIDNNVLINVVYSNNVRIVGYDASCGNDVIMPNKINNMSISEIGDSVFEGYDKEEKIESLLIPNTITKIGPNAFEMNKISGAIDLSGATNLTQIYKFAFSGNQIAGIKLPSNITELGWLAFAYNPLVSISGGNATMNISIGAFGCEELPEDNSLTGEQVSGYDNSCLL